MAGFALIIPADGDRPIRMEPFNRDDTLHWLQGLVDGSIETVPCAFTRQNALLICNEDGRNQGLPLNVRAYVAVPTEYD